MGQSAVLSQQQQQAAPGHLVSSGAGQNCSQTGGVVPREGKELRRAMDELTLPVLTAVKMDGAGGKPAQMRAWLYEVQSIFKRIGADVPMWWGESLAAAGDAVSRWLKALPMQRATVAVNSRSSPAHADFEVLVRPAFLEALPQWVANQVNAAGVAGVEWECRDVL